ncbi:MAG: phosphate acetyltransferase [Deltaproteobacteria bacterium]|jgi:phosphate acetyltransferase|nr:phosphate acetyltransferase [Deltaproteobacteria bacterium]
MGNSAYITASESKSGKSAIMLGMMQLLLKRLRTVAIFRPIINQPLGSDTFNHDIRLLMQHFGLDIPYEDTHAYTLEVARDLINRGERPLLLETIFNKFKQLESQYDFVLCEGTDFLGKDAAVEFELNMEIAANLACPVVLVVNAAGKELDDLLEPTNLTINLMRESGLEIAACLVNRSSLSKSDSDKLTQTLHAHNVATPMTVSVLPEEPKLANPTVGDVCKWINGKILYGEKRLDNLVGAYLVAAMQVGNFLEHLVPDSLIVTPSDREDIVLACLSARQSSAFPNVSGIVLSGGIPLHSSVKQLLDNWEGSPIPIIATEGHTFLTMQKINSLYGRIEPEDKRKIYTAIGIFEQYVEGEDFAGRVINRKSSRITPKMFEYGLLEKAKRDKMRIVLPEGQDERILQAADVLLRRNVADLIILGDQAKLAQDARVHGLDLSKAEVIDPQTSALLEEYTQSYHELRKHKGINLEQARDIMLDPTYFGTMMVQKGYADGMVSGAVNTTAHTIRPAFEIIRTKTQGTTVSSVFFMCLKDRVLVFGDCAVLPNPTPQELANIAVNSAETAAVFGIEPRVAMLSYSTGSSGKGEDVDKVKEATSLAKQMVPDLLLEGPLQYDAAIDPRVAKTKMPDNPVAGKATVFIFPDLNTGNNTYKAVQRAADAIAVGPVLQGLKKPVNDLSRGANVADIINTVAITAIQAQAVKAAAGA